MIHPWLLAFVHSSLYIYITLFLTHARTHSTVPAAIHGSWCQPTPDPVHCSWPLPLPHPPPYLTCPSGQAAAIKGRWWRCYSLQALVGFSTCCDTCSNVLSPSRSNSAIKGFKRPLSSDHLKNKNNFPAKPFFLPSFSKVRGGKKKKSHTLIALRAVNVNGSPCVQPSTCGARILSYRKFIWNVGVGSRDMLTSVRHHMFTSAVSPRWSKMTKNMSLQIREALKKKPRCQKATLFTPTPPGINEKQAPSPSPPTSWRKQR